MGEKIQPAKVENHIEDDLGSSKKLSPKSIRLFFILSLALLVVAAGLGTYFTFAAWSGLTQAKEDYSIASDEYDSAQADLALAQSYLDQANSDYYSYLACWASTSYFWDFLCGSEWVYTDAVDTAENWVSEAQLSVTSASSAMSGAQTRIDNTQKQFNTALTISVVATSITAMLAIVFTLLFIRSRRNFAKAQEKADSPEWDCPNCSSHNLGGIFCVDCGQKKEDTEKTKPELKVTSVNAQPASKAQKSSPTAKPGVSKSRSLPKGDG